MFPETTVLCLAAVAIGAMHTLLGPDHYLPFVAMAKAGGWTARKTLGLTVACGLAHVGGSVAIGLVGLLLGAEVMKMESFEALRGDMAAWLLIGFGLATMAWGTRQAMRGGPREPVDAHADGTTHPPAAASRSAWMPWMAFLVFVLGPCEPLIPLLLVPAARMNAGAVALVVAAFTVATVGTMSIVVMAMRLGLANLQVPSASRLSHVLAGLAIMACGVLVKLGL